MKRVTKIVNFETSEMFTGVGFTRDESYEVVVQGEDYFYQGPAEGVAREPVYGMCLNKTRGYLVEMDEKAIALHKYIVGCTYTPNTNSKIADACFVLGSTLDRVMKDNGKKDYALFKLEHDAISVVGYGDSVVVSENVYDTSESGHHVMSVYDFLGYLCRATKLFVMGYEKVVIGSRWRRSATELKLSRTDEAMRFFTKMYMDVMSK